MSAGFDFAGQVTWGTNGAIELYLETLAEQASARFGRDDAFATCFRDEREMFAMGQVVRLDSLLAPPGAVTRFLEILDASTAQLLGGDALSDYGRRWVETEIADLRRRIESAAVGDVR